MLVVPHSFLKFECILSLQAKRGNLFPRRGTTCRAQRAEKSKISATPRRGEVYLALSVPSLNLPPQQQV